jgi:branched-chain amino acid transport system permease protein
VDVELIQQLINGLSLGAIYALIALGYTMVFGVLRFINFAHGDVLMIGSFTGILLVTSQAGRLNDGLGGEAMHSLVGTMPFWRMAFLWLVGGLVVLAAILWFARGAKGRPFLLRPLFWMPLLTAAAVLYLPLLGRLCFGVADDTLPHTGWAIFVLVSAMLVCAGFGMSVERICYRPLRTQPRITVLITAIGVSLLLESLGQFGFGTQPQSFPDLVEPRPIDFSTPWEPVIGGHKLFSLPFDSWMAELSVTNRDLMIFGITVFLLLSLIFIVKWTKIGMAMRALAYNPTACSLMGVNTDFVISFTFGLGSALAGAAGIMVSAQNSQAEPLMGVLYGLKAFVAAVLGGIGNLTGAVLGGLLIGVLETLCIAYFSSTYKDGVAFAVLILILLIRPAGLLGKNIREKV